jgi:molybdopterin molybdotransferase
MLEKRKPVSVQEAIHKIVGFAKKGDSEVVTITESANRILSNPIVADHDVPPFDRSPYDGYAIRSIDTQNASSENPIQFKVIEEIGAGSVAKTNLQENDAIRIMTGAQMPEGADAVVMLELTSEEKRNGQTFMFLKRKIKEGDNISRRGEDTLAGEVIVQKGVEIHPGIHAVLATFGYDKLNVAKKPRVGFMSTGSELLGVEESLQPGKIRDSNSYMVAAQIEKAGGEPIRYPSLPDQFEQCFQAVRKALEETDLLITTGGVSVGDYDYLPDIYKELGAEVLFNKVGMRPGSVTTVARYKDKWLFGLSGNPSACFVGFELFARPIIRAWMGDETPHLPAVQAVLQSDFPKANPFTRFVRASYKWAGNQFEANPNRLDKSNVVMSLASTNCLMVLPGGTRGYQKGDKVTILLLDVNRGQKVGGVY